MCYKIRSMLSGKCHAELKVRHDRVIIIQQAPLSLLSAFYCLSQHSIIRLFCCLFYFIFRLVVHPCLVVCSLYSTSFSKCLPATTYKCIHPPFHTNSHSCSMHVPTHMASIAYTHIFELTSCVSDWLSLRLSSRAFCNSDSSPWRQRCSCRGGIVTSSALPSWQ